MNTPAKSTALVAGFRLPAKLLLAALLLFAGCDAGNSGSGGDPTAGMGSAAPADFAQDALNPRVIESLADNYFAQAETDFRQAVDSGEALRAGAQRFLAVQR